MLLLGSTNASCITLHSFQAICEITIQEISRQLAELDREKRFVETAGYRD
jgi:hypothetical protein